MKFSQQYLNIATATGFSHCKSNQFFLSKHPHIMKSIIKTLICHTKFLNLPYYIMQQIDSDIQQAISTLKRGGVILYPTDTVWGLGCDATRSDAVKRIYEIKKRADSKAMITLLSNPDDLWRYLDDVPEVAFQLIEAAVRPLTIVYDHGRNVAPELLAPDGSIGIRITQERVSSTLCQCLRRPLVSTSANISSQPTPSIFREISSEIINAVDYVMTSRRDDNRKTSPSQVIKLTDSAVITILRK